MEELRQQVSNVIKFTFGFMTFIFAGVGLVTVAEGDVLFRWPQNKRMRFIPFRIHPDLFQTLEQPLERNLEEVVPKETTEFIK
jgi:hypothetical protein